MAFFFLLSVTTSIVKGLRCSNIIGHTELWYAAGTVASDFSSVTGDVRTGIWPGCNGTCTGIYGQSTAALTGDVRKYQSTVGYTDIALIYDTNPNGLETGDSCTFYYSPNGGSSWNVFASYQNDTDYDGEVKYLGSDASNNTNFQFRFSLSCSSGYCTGDYCNNQFFSICGVISFNPFLYLLLFQTYNKYKIKKYRYQLQPKSQQ